MTQNLDVTALLSPPNLLGCKRVLCIQPHPDDNEIGAGGTIAALTRTGCEVHYLTITNGDKGNLDYTATKAQTAQTRRQEAEKSGRILGATHFHFLDHGDAELSDVLSLSKEIAEVIRVTQPDAILCPDPWLLYEAHYDHHVTGMAASNAFQMSGSRHLPDGQEPWRAAAIGYYFTANPNTVIDITDTFEIKFQAIAAHESQIDEQTMAMFRLYFTMKGQELAAGKGFALGEGLKVLSQLHTHCFVDAYKI